MPRDSIEKNLSQIAVVAAAPFFYGQTVYMPPQTLTISASFWREYRCVPACGACCLNYTMDYLPAEFQQFSTIYPEHVNQFIKRQIVINGETFDFYSYMNGDGKQKAFCGFLDQSTGFCTIHTLNALSCQVEMIKLRDISGRGLITKQPYGRAWIMKRIDGERGAICEWEDRFSEKQFLENDMPVLQRLKSWADYLHIETYLDKILDKLTNYYQRGLTYQPIKIKG